jgi:hypothetical protein
VFRKEALMRDPLSMKMQSNKRGGYGENYYEARRNKPTLYGRANELILDWSLSTDFREGPDTHPCNHSQGHRQQQ